MFQEYPKALYRNGEYREVTSLEQETDARQDGWTDWATDHAAKDAPVQAPAAAKEPEAHAQLPLPPASITERPKLTVAKR